MDSLKTLTFNKGDLVFAKLKHYPHWPAEIKEVFLNNKGKPLKYDVLFFGDNTTATVKQADVHDFTENRGKYGNPKTDNAKNKRFNAALEEAEKIFSLKNNKKGVNDSPSQIADMEDLHAKLINFNSLSDPDLETSLTLAAEVGNTLLAENYKLKQELQNKVLENSKLALKSSKINHFDETNYQYKIESLEQDNETILNRNNALAEIIQETERQLEKERLLRTELTKTFEEFDKEKEESIKKHVNIIRKLEGEIKHLKQTAVSKECNQTIVVNSYKDMETQTEPHNSETLGSHSNSLLLSELAKIRLRQDEMEKSINTLLGKLSPSHTAIPAQLDTATLNKPKLNAEQTYWPSDSCTTNPRRNNLKKQNPLELMSDNEDETQQTRSTRHRAIRTSAINSNSGCKSHLHPLDSITIENLKIFSFNPEETPLVTSQLNSDSDWNKACGIGLFDTDTSKCSVNMASMNITDRIRLGNLSYNNFITTTNENKKPYIIICYSSQQKNWKKKVFQLLELANDCFKFPLLFTIDLEKALEEVQTSYANVKDFLQVLFQFANNAYLHRIRLYVQDKKLKKTVDTILDDCLYKSQKKILRLSTDTTSIYNTWRKAGTSYSSPDTYSPQRLLCKTKGDYVRAALNEQMELWRAKENRLLHEFSCYYRAHNLNNFTSENNKLKETIKNSKEKYAVIDLTTGNFLVSQNSTKPYQYGFDGAHFVELKGDTSLRHTAVEKTSLINNTLLVSKQTQVMNDLHLYNRIKMLKLDEVPDLKIKLIQGVPGCGKTTTILKTYRKGDLVLFPTREGADDFRTRFKDLNTDCDNTTLGNLRTVHSFILNSTNYLKNGGTYKRLIVDEALMIHAGETLFAALLAGVTEIILIGDTNQIPYINRIDAFEVKYHEIIKITEITEVLTQSFRCTRTTAAILSDFYKQGMTTNSQVMNEMTKIHIDNVNNLQIDHKYKVLVFKQSEKTELSNLGYNVSTIHEYQGKQSDHIAIVRTSTKEEDIYNSLPHCIVAVSRHKKSLLYASPFGKDTISTWMERASFYSTKDLLMHYRESKKQTETQSTPVESSENKFTQISSPDSNLLANPQITLPNQQTSPPIYAKIRPHDESVEKFFSKHISFYMQLIGKQIQDKSNDTGQESPDEILTTLEEPNISTPNVAEKGEQSQNTTNSPKHFLSISLKKKEREKKTKRCLFTT